MNVLCRVAMLGGLQACAGGREITRFRTQKAAALLAYLAYHRDSPHPREVLIELLWPWTSLAAGRNRLSVELSSLRRQLEPPGVERGTVILADRSSIQLSPEAVATDVAEFEHALASARDASTELAEIQSLTEAVELYRGPLLPGHYEDWVLPEQERLCGLYVSTVGDLTAHLASSGDYDRAVEYARRAVGMEPLSESVHQNLIGLLAATGQLPAALRQFGEMERLLAEELGQGLSPDSEALREQLAAGTGAPEIEIVETGKVAEPNQDHSRLPAGTVTLLLASAASRDEAGSTRAEIETATLAEMRRCGGFEVKGAGGVLTIAFDRPTHAVRCALSCRDQLAKALSVSGGSDGGLRMALDTGELESKTGGYSGPVLDRAHGLLLASRDWQILCSEATAGVLRTDLPDDIALVDHGYFTLRGVSNVQRVFSITASDRATTDEPSPRAAFAYLTSLPPQFTRFFGREQELADIEHLILDDQTRLATLTGPAGSGKTRLSVEAAGRLTEAFRGAVWFVPLQELREPALIGDAIVDVLGLDRSPQAEPMDQVCEILSRQPSLLVLDNYEHLVEDGASVLQSLLERADSLTCLVTSRQSLNLTAEREYFVEPLPTPTVERGPAELIGCPSVQLFVDRAQAVRPAFQITEGNAEDIAMLCNHLDGIPLAVELAAARAQVMTPARMLEQVRSRFTFLVSRRRDVAERHRTLRAAIDWSHELLRKELQRFFARLSVFRGGWVVEAAETVCEEPRALEYIEELLECSMVAVNVSAAPDLDDRFRMLETVREYGWEHLTPEERDRVRDSHAQYFMALARQAESHLRGPEQVYWLQRLAAEQDNLRAALSWLAESEAGTSDGIALSTALARFWVTQGHVSEGRAWVAEFLSRVEGSEADTTSARALIAAGELATAAGDVEGAPPLLEQARDLCARLEDHEGMAAALASLGLIATWASDFQAAHEAYAASLASARQAGDRWSIATALGGLSRVAAMGGRSGQARELAEEHLVVERELGDPVEIAEALHNVGVAAMVQGDHGPARAALEECLQIRRDIRYPVGIAQALYDLGQDALWSGDLTRAREYFEECRELCLELDFPFGLLLPIWGLARVAYEEGDTGAACRLVLESMHFARSVEFTHGLGSILRTAAQVAIAEDDMDRASDYLAEGLTCTIAVDDLRLQAECVDTLSELLVMTGNAELCATLMSAVDALRARVDTARPAVERDDFEHMRQRAHQALGEEAFERASSDGAAMDWAEALRIAQDTLDEHVPDGSVAADHDALQDGSPR